MCSQLETINRIVPKLKGKRGAYHCENQLENLLPGQRNIGAATPVSSFNIITTSLRLMKLPMFSEDFWNASS